MVTLHAIPTLAAAPICRECYCRTSRHITRASNRNGNAGRPYYKCDQCNKFHCFDDDRGNDPRNPRCLCQVASRQQVAGPEKAIPRGLHYVCRSGQCNFYTVRRDVNAQQITVTEDLVEMLARLEVI